jgi:hypothetical protein
MTEENKKLRRKYTKTEKSKRSVWLKNKGFESEEHFFKYCEEKVTVSENKESIEEPTIEELTNFLVENKTELPLFKDGKFNQEVIDLYNQSKEDCTDIVIAFDTTGSMYGYISAVKRHIVNLIPELFKNSKNLKISIVAFGDYCDAQIENGKVIEFGEAYQICALTNNENDLISFVNNSKGTDGGDYEEFYELVLQKIRTETNWRKNSNRSILLIADATPHPVGYMYKGLRNTIDWRLEASILNKMNIKVDTLQCGGEEWYKELSTITNGINLPFSSSYKTEQLVRGYTYARSGSLESFATYKAEAEVSGDEELIGLSKSLSTLL